MCIRQMPARLAAQISSAPGARKAFTDLREKSSEHLRGSRSERREKRDRFFEDE